MYSTEHLEIGYKIGSHYEIQKVLGQGGFGIVYLVKDKHQLDKILVVKELFSKEFSFRNRDSVTVSNKTKAQNIFKKIKEGIIREVNILSKIRNPNVVEAYGHLEENNTTYSVMEYIEGTDLGKYVEEHGVFDEDEAKNLLRQLIHGLKEIHNQNIIHRDIKPSNIMRTPEGIYKIIDFSTNKKYSDNSITAITGFTNHVFTSPELQETKAEVGKFSDIYSIGMTLLRVLSTEERLPNLTDRLTDPSKNDSSFHYYIDILDISKEFKKIIKKMTALKAINRYQSLEEIEEVLTIVSKTKEKKVETSIETEILFEEEKEDIEGLFKQEPVQQETSSLPKKQKSRKRRSKSKSKEFTIETVIKILMGVTGFLLIVLLIVFLLK